MSVTTKVSGNLLVSPDTTEANFKNSLAQTRTGIIEPSSTVDGLSFFWHSTSANVAASGAQSDNKFSAYSEAEVVTPSNALADTGAGKTNYDKAFNDNYGFTSPAVGDVAYAYIDYNFYLKATSSEDNQKVSMSKCNLLYNGAAVTDKAWRVAVFATAGQTTAAAAESASFGAAKSLLTLAGAANQSANQAVSSTTALGAVTYNTAATVDNEINATNTRYYKVMARLWLEGEDTTCKNDTYALLTEAFSLELNFSLGNAAGITNIGSVPAA